MRIPSFRRTLLRVSPLLVVACASGGPPAPPPPSGLTLLQCPVGNRASAEAMVDSAGDALRVRGHTFLLHPGSVRQVGRFRVDDRADGYAGVDVQPHGTVFDVPATLTLSYARCADAAAPFSQLRIVEVRPGGTAIVDSTLDSQWNKADRTVTVRLRHLSGYLIAGT